MVYPHEVLTGSIFLQMSSLEISAIPVLPQEDSPVAADRLAKSRELLRSTVRYECPSFAHSMWQFLSTFAFFALSMALMFWAYDYSYLLTCLLGVFAGGLLLRLFVIQHDCGHGSFFDSKEWNDVIGCFCSLFTLIPYYYWRRQHALHHASNGNLDHRGHGDMDVMTVNEYLSATPLKRLRYRIYRNPFVFLVLGPIFFVTVINRFAFDRKKTSARERRNVYTTNATLALFALAIGLCIGFEKLFWIALPVVYVAAGGGIWLFYIQHQFEHTYWRKDREWDYVTAAMQGSSFYNLSKPLRWLTGSIGYHHIHHLRPTIPNYCLQRCHEENPDFQKVFTVTFWESLQYMFLSLWDEQQERLISFREFARRYRSTPALS